jgi:D-glycerate 3-kinase
MAADPHAPPSTGFPDRFAARVLADVHDHRCRVYAIAGLQGTGKTTLSRQVAALAQGQGLRVATVSLDDFYLDHSRRRELGRTVHPLCATRGVPGTHDVALACETIDALHAGRTVALPRFDKLADDRLPPSQWPRVGPVELVLVEGWCLKVAPQDEAALATPVNALERDEDPQGTWRRWSNASLALDYPALWSRLGRMLFLQPPGFDIVAHWRWQQEQALQAMQPGRPAMDQARVERFVQFFERVSRQALATLPHVADRIIRIDAQRRPLDEPASDTGHGGPR